MTGFLFLFLFFSFLFFYFLCFSFLSFVGVRGKCVCVDGWMEIWAGKVVEGGE